MAGANGNLRYVAFLKGINVGGHTVKMERLRRLFEAMGHAAVETYLASGNVLFESPSERRRELASAIAERLAAELGYAVPSFVRSATDLSRIAAWRPSAGPPTAFEARSLYIVFLPAALGPDAAKRVEAASTDTDRFSVAGEEIYWLCWTRFIDSPFSGPALERLVGAQVTVRNSTTVTRMAARFAARERQE